MSDTSTIVQKLWNYCNVLRDDGLSYRDYVEQLTYLLFLKMADERTRPPFNRPRSSQTDSTGRHWSARRRRLDVHYRHILNELGKQPGTLGVIFRKAQNKIQDPAKLRRLVVGPHRQGAMDDPRRRRQGRRLRRLLAKNAEDMKTGAGQYFTPRP